MSKSDYLFTSQRLGFRNWTEADKAPYAQMNASQEVMRHFPTTLSKEASDRSADELKAHYERFGYTYFATDELSSGSFIGFIGLKWKDIDYHLSPFTDIGWRLAPEFQGKGYATEGARACLKYAFDTLRLEEIYSIAAHTNLNSIKVMQKIGMTMIENFIHPDMDANSPLQPCHCYKISRSQVL